MDEICYKNKNLDMDSRNYCYHRNLSFEKILLIVFISISTAILACPNTETSDSQGESKEFWPPDMVPHPSLPGDGPSGPKEPEMS